MDYTYLVATLPMLRWGAPPPMSTQEFQRQCGGVLRSEDEADLVALLESHPEKGTSSYARAWSGLEAQVRNQVVRWRAGRKQVEASPFLREEPVLSGYVEREVSEALAKSNPLEREELLDQCRWFWAGELALNDPFGLAPVLAFGIKLALLERWHPLDSEEGAKRVRHFITEQLEKRGMATEFDVEVL